jgi:hypothetical protein
VAKIQNGSPIARPTQVASRPVETAPKPKATEQAQVNKGWAPKASGVSAAKAPKYPEVATDAKAFVDAYKSASKAMSQMDMVEGSVTINNAADKLLKSTMNELASQYADRGQDAKSDAVLKDLEKFMKHLGPAKHYRLDPDRGTMASLEDNGDRMTKLMGKLTSVANELGKVNKEPAGDFQQAYNRNAGGEAVMQEARFAVAFEKAYNKDEAVLGQAEAFFKTLPKKIDSQIESRGGTMEPLERAGGTATALAEMTKKLGGE